MLTHADVRVRALSQAQTLYVVRGEAWPAPVVFPSQIVFLVTRSEKMAPPPPLIGASRCQNGLFRSASWCKNGITPR
jgi:hypothetical protein